MESFVRLSFITQLKIEFVLPITGCRKVLGKMPDSRDGLHRIFTESAAWR